ncbi:hypothetical protein FHS01_004041 [Longimicrobium terrae]|uniref:Uncharacterized protein n=1 Tax=Longimicrobium terrae TaxID=1639882 RepID=A0A841H309_9BACT|nr:hypothetical protein [Longimicrobium terrae]MBB6072229.1 hypothetical protein [Longimicrobium terrae]
MCSARISEQIASRMLRRGTGIIGLLAGAAVAACGTGRGSRVSDDLGALYTRQDSVWHAGWRLYSLVGVIDRVGRTAGSLPLTLYEIRDERVSILNDPWGREFRYAPTGTAFELRSAGSDGAFDSGDDIVALARLGRAFPCELRDELQTTRYERIAPLCATGEGTTVYRLCPALNESDRPERIVPATQRDSISATGRRLVRVARAIDGYGREIGTLPETFRGPGIGHRDDRGELPDMWGTIVRYVRAGTAFELRSAGPDRIHGSADDIAVSATLGSSIPCLFRTQWGDEQCWEAPPAC